MIKRGAVVLAVVALATVAVHSELNPPVPDTSGIVKSEYWARVLGKAMFWDIRSGSDGNACGSCHFSAGADSRIVNQFNPGFRQLPAGDTSFGGVDSFDGEGPLASPVGVTASGGVVDSSYAVVSEDLPFHQLSDEHDRNSPILFTSNDILSSAGSFSNDFISLKKNWLGDYYEKCTTPRADVFQAGGHAARQVEPRNTPTVINAIFNLVQLWDGRANRIFNGVDTFGKRDIAHDPNKRLIVLHGSHARLGYLELDGASLASQAVGPQMEPLEMTCTGRPFAVIGRKLLASGVRPLQSQRVDHNDSLLGPYVHWSGKGLRYSYKQLIKKAFHSKYWKALGYYKISDGRLRRLPNSGYAHLRGYTQMETNFPMFWGIAIMHYEATLVSDQSKFDTWFASCDPATTRDDDPSDGDPDRNVVPVKNPVTTCQSGDPDPTAAEHGGFTELEVLGFSLWNRPGLRDAGNPSCRGCHSHQDGLFSEAQREAGTEFVPVERSRIDLTNLGCPGDVCGGTHDRGFFNIGTRPTSFDPGNGGTDPYGNPLSTGRMFLAEQAGEGVVDPSGIDDRCNTPGLVEPGGTPIYPGCDVDPNNPGPLDESLELELVDGSFKTPTLRNIGLTPPYFHYGGYGDLRTVVEFYARGGSRRDKSLADATYNGDTSGSGILGKGPVPAAGPDHGTNVDFFIRDIQSTDEQIDALVAFMLTLTDRRVQCDAAPFDHPEVPVTIGHEPDDSNGNNVAVERMAVVPAVGAGGYESKGMPELCLPNSGNLFDPDLRNRLIE
jgi:cytochrome c peroxidase